MGDPLGGVLLPPGIIAGESEVAVIAVRGVFLPFLTTTDHPSPAVAAASLVTAIVFATAGAVGFAGFTGWAGLGVTLGFGVGCFLPVQLLA